MAIERNISAQTIWQRYRYAGLGQQVYWLNAALDLMAKTGNRSKEQCLFNVMGYLNDDPTNTQSWYKK